MTPVPKIGDVLEVAIWLDGKETPFHVDQWKRDCPNLFRSPNPEYALMIGDLHYSIKRPGEDRVPQPPAHVSGPDVRLLVAEATVKEVKPVAGLKRTSFLADLEPKDLNMLRRATRRAWAHYNKERLSDAACDTYIEEHGPESAAAVIRTNGR